MFPGGCSHECTTCWVQIKYTPLFLSEDADRGWKQDILDGHFYFSFFSSNIELIWQTKYNHTKRTSLLLGVLHVQSEILSSSGLWGYTMLFSLAFVLYLPDLSTLCSLCGDVSTSRASPRGCCPLCHLSSPCCRLSMLNKLPELLRCYDWHTRWLVCMSVCVFYEVSGCHRLAASETARFPVATCCATPLRYVLSHVITAKTGWRKQKLANKTVMRRE